MTESHVRMANQVTVPSLTLTFQAKSVTLFPSLGRVTLITAIASQFGFPSFDEGHSKELGIEIDMLISSWVWGSLSLSSPTQRLGLG